MRVRPLGALVLLGVLWGGSFLFIRVAVPALGPALPAERCGSSWRPRPRSPTPSRRAASRRSGRAGGSSCCSGASTRRRAHRAHSGVGGRPDGLARGDPELDDPAVRRRGGGRLGRGSALGQEGRRAGAGDRRGGGARRVGPHTLRAGRRAADRRVAAGRPPVLRARRHLRRERAFSSGAEPAAMAG